MEKVLESEASITEIETHHITTFIQALTQMKQQMEVWVSQQSIPPEVSVKKGQEVFLKIKKELDKTTFSQQFQNLFQSFESLIEQPSENVFQNFDQMLSLFENAFQQCQQSSRQSESMSFFHHESERKSVDVPTTDALALHKDLNLETIQQMVNTLKEKKQSIMNDVQSGELYVTDTAEKGKEIFLAVKSQLEQIEFNEAFSDLYQSFEGVIYLPSNNVFNDFDHAISVLSKSGPLLEQISRTQESNTEGPSDSSSSTSVEMVEQPIAIVPEEKSENIEPEQSSQIKPVEHHLESEITSKHIIVLVRLLFRMKSQISDKLANEKISFSKANEQGLQVFFKVQEQLKKLQFDQAFPELYRSFKDMVELPSNNVFDDFEHISTLLKKALVKVKKKEKQRSATGLSKKESIVESVEEMQSSVEEQLLADAVQPSEVVSELEPENKEAIIEPKSAVLSESFASESAHQDDVEESEEILSVAEQLASNAQEDETSQVTEEPFVPLTEQLVNEAELNISSEELPTANNLITETIESKTTQSEESEEILSVAEQLARDTDDSMLPFTPVEPAAAEEPFAPVEAEVTEEPFAPVEAEVTEEPFAPVEAEVTEEPFAPVEAEVTEEPFTPVEAAVTEESFTPVEPAVAEEPFAPVEAAAEEPFTPVEPAVAEEPFAPVEPAVAEEPFAPVEAAAEEPFTPVEPAVAEEPFAPVEPEVAEEPFAPVEPEVTEEPFAPVEPAVAEEPFSPVEPAAAEQPHLTLTRQVIDDIQVDEGEVSEESIFQMLQRLKTVKQQVQVMINEDKHSLKRMATSLSISSEKNNFQELFALTKALEAADLNEMDDYTSKLVDFLQEVAQEAELERSKLLIVHQDQLLAQQLKKILSAPTREIIIAHNAAEAEKQMELNEIVLLILSLKLPDLDGRHFLINMKKRLNNAHIPTIILSHGANKVAKSECFALGAEAFFRHPLDLTLVAAAVSEKLSRILNKKKDSRQDPLTSLPNKKAFIESFERIAAFLRRSQDPLSIALLDFDNIDEINKSLGHAAGDKLLRDAGQVIAKTLRTSDFLARWSGNKFVAYFPNTNNAGATLALEKALDKIKEHVFTFGDETISQVTFTGGVAQIADRMTIEEGVARASHYRYLAQEEGSGKVKSLAKVSPSKARKAIVSPGKQLPLDAKVLLVEDQPIIANVLKYYLEREGFEIHHLPDGEAALDAAGNHKFTLIILDVKIPKMDGFELLQHMRKRPMLRHTPIVMLTSMGREKDIIRGFELGASDYILKPFSPAELLVRLRRLLEQAA